MAPSSGFLAARESRPWRPVDSRWQQVPYVIAEGKRRDFTLVGAKEVGEYLKTLEAVAKEAH